MPKLYDIKAPISAYTDGTGQQRTRWLNVGQVFKNQSGRLSIKLDAVPTTWADPEHAGWCQCFDPNESTLRRDGANVSGKAPSDGHQGPARSELDLDDDIPF